VNTVTGQKQSTFPPIWQGGILADEMGLGKTLSMISLIASDQDSPRNGFGRNNAPIGHRQVNSTLVVVPPNGKYCSITSISQFVATNFIVLSVWEHQLAL